MTKDERERSLFRLLDANLNRLREGIRVCEDIQRYTKNNKELSQKLKSIRHQSRIKNYNELLNSRDIINDVLKKTTKSESNRENLEAITIANMKRAQESARVLEECLKLFDSLEANRFKHIRYELYDIEKKL
jgi:thiamine-phosphate pyrophosphorylase